MPQRLQTVIIDKSRASSRSAAERIARRFASSIYTSRETTNTWRFRQFPPEECSGNPYSVSPESGVTLFYCDRIERG